MNLWMITMVKDEQDTIGHWIRHAASEGATGVIVADNMSTDGTQEAIYEARHDVPHDFIRTWKDPEVGYYQSRKMSDLAEQAAMFGGAEWIVPADADEIWSADRPLVEYIAARDFDNCHILNADIINHYCTDQDNPHTPNPFQRMTWRAYEAGPLPKVAFKWRPGAVIHQGNHGVTLPGSAVTNGGLTASHFPYRSAEQFVRKARNGAAAYAATDLPPSMGDHWRRYGDVLERDGEAACADIFREHFYYRNPAEQGLINDPAPFRRWA